MKKESHIENIILFMLGFIPVIWFALLIAPYMYEGLFVAIAQLSHAMNDPFSIQWCDESLRTVGLFIVIYLCGIGIYLSNKKNYRHNEEYGSAKWAKTYQVNKKYADKDYSQNKLLSQNVRLGLDGKKHRRNLNTLVIGGSGAGKTRFYVKTNIMQCNTSFVILDPKGEILRDTGFLLEKEGYVIKVIDLINMNKSHCYNPFEYIQDDKDVLKLITNLIRNTTPKGSQTNDPFGKSQRLHFLRLCVYIFFMKPLEKNRILRWSWK